MAGTDPTPDTPDPDFLAQVLSDPDCFSFVELEPGGFTPRFGGDLEDKSFALGVRGDIGIGTGLAYDVSFRYGENQIDFFITNTVNASLGPDTPRSFNPGGYGQIENVFNADFSYGLPVAGFASDLNLGFGYEYRDEQFEIRQGDGASFEIGPLASQGFSSSSNGFGGFTPQSAGKSDQSANSAYLDLEADLVPQLTVQAAVRYEDYDTFGSDTNYKVGGVYRITDNVRARGTWSTGFHAPTAGQANVVNITTQIVNGQLRDQGTFPLSSPAGQLVADYVATPGGLTEKGAARPTLTPEESENYTLGMAFDLSKFTVTVDYFNIELEDRISRSSTLSFVDALDWLASENNVNFGADPTVFSRLQALDAAGVLNISDFAGSEDLQEFAFFNNAFNTATEGVDIVMTGPLSFIPYGDTSLALAFNYTDTKVKRRDATVSDERVRALEEGLPDTKGSVTLTNHTGALRLLGRVNYYGGSYDIEAPTEVDSMVTVDLELGYEVMDGLELIVGAANAFDSYPNENPNATSLGNLYPQSAAAGFNGGMYYLKARKTW